jgi:hypothetical protein
MLPALSLNSHLQDQEIALLPLLSALTSALPSRQISQMTKLFVLPLTLLFFSTFVLAPGSAARPASESGTDSFLISHVTVIPMDSNQVLPDRSVLIEHGKISRISASEIPVPKSVKTIDGHGKFLMPALADLHVHLFSPDDFPAYVIYGVANVLNMDGGPLHLIWRRQVSEGKLLGPAIYTAGHTVDGFPPLNELFLTAETPEQGRAIVRQQKRSGYDAIKLYGTLRPDVFQAILQTAREEKIPVVGHINRQVGALEVLKSSQVLAAHLEDLLFARFDQPPSDAELVAFADAIAASHITVTPNLNVNPANIAQLENLDAVLHSSESALLSPAAYSQWMPANNRHERNDQTPQQVEQMKQVQQILYKFVRLLSDRHVPLVLGTDAAAYGFPGLSVHQELHELVEAGVSPYEALRSATANAGAFIATNISGAPQFGIVAEGAQADLLLLSANPLENIQNVEQITGVMLRGRWLSAAQLAGLGAQSNARTAKTKLAIEKIDAALEAGDVAPANQFRQSNTGSESPWYAEWVLMTKARKLQQKNLLSSIAVARLETALYPDSSHSWYLVADLLFANRDLPEASNQLQKSLALEPFDAAARNLQEKIEALRQPLQFSPAGDYSLEYKNDRSAEAVKAVLHVEKSQGGQLRATLTGLSNGPISVSSILAGANRLWISADSPSGPLEFRITVSGSGLTGYWDGLFGNNGPLSGSKSN